MGPDLRDRRPYAPHYPASNKEVVEPAEPATEDEAKGGPEEAKGEGNKSLITNEKFLSFEIQFEWKLSPNSNSGFMWGVSEDSKYYAPYVTGPEIQIIESEVYGDDPRLA